MFPKLTKFEKCTSDKKSPPGEISGVGTGLELFEEL
jgi:hypothetical protein